MDETLRKVMDSFLWAGKGQFPKTLLIAWQGSEERGR